MKKTEMSSEIICAWQSGKYTDYIPLRFLADKGKMMIARVGTHNSFSYRLMTDDEKARHPRPYSSYHGTSFGYPAVCPFGELASNRTLDSAAKFALLAQDMATLDPSEELNRIAQGEKCTLDPEIGFAVITEMMPVRMTWEQALRAMQYQEDERQKLVSERQAQDKRVSAVLVEAQGRGLKMHWSGYEKRFILTLDEGEALAQWMRECGNG